MIVLMTTLSGCEEKTKEPDEIVYLKESQIIDFFKNPEGFKGQYIKLTGEVFSISQNDEKRVAVQVWHDISNFEQDFFLSKILWSIQIVSKESIRMIMC